MYLRTFIATVVGLLLLLGAWAYLVNPYAVFSVDLFQVLTERKTAAADKGRTIKSYQVLKQRPQILLIGNSRVEVGLPPDHPFYRGKVFNLGLPGAGVVMQYDYGWHAIQSTQTVTEVVIAIDFVDFLTKNSTKDQLMLGEWQNRLNFQLSTGVQPVAQQWFQLKEKLSFLVSQTAFVDTLLTLVQQQRDVNALSATGFSDGRLYHQQVKDEGFDALYQQKQHELNERLKNTTLKLTHTSEAFRALKLFLQLLAEKKIAVTLLINPYHSPYLDIINQNGLMDEFTSWKFIMTELARLYQLPLYDFSIRSPLVMQPLLKNSHNIADNKWFWEPAHYRHAFGKLMLDALAQKSCEIDLDGQRVTICKQF
jgi:hypothetical protein